MAITKEAIQDWKGILDHKAFTPINSTLKKRTLVQLFENCASNDRLTFENADRVRAFSRSLLTETPTTATTVPVGPTNTSGPAGAASTGINPGLQPDGTTTGNVGDGSALAGFDPTMITLIRRSQPSLIAYDLVGVQPMSAPTGLIFALHARRLNADGTNGVELFGGDTTDYLNKAQQFASAGTGVVNGPTDPIVDANGFAKVNTQTGEVLGAGTYAWKRASMTISRVNVTADTKALMAEYTHEIVQDMKRVHGVDAEAELSNILATEIGFEQNRELIETIRSSAKSYGSGVVDLTLGGIVPAALVAGGNNSGANTAVQAPVASTVTSGNFGAFGSAERFKALLLHIEQASNSIARETRRGKANWVLVSSDVAALLHLAGVLTINPDLKSSVDIADDTQGASVLGTLIGGQKVIVDPYATQGQVVVGYKGKTAMDSGMFWCPYVPLEKAVATDPNTFQPRMGFKTRYGIGANPIAEGFLGSVNGPSTVANAQGLYNSKNTYFRKFTVLY